MDVEDKRYVVGIDLGTTNSAVSYVDLQATEKRSKINVFKIPQLTGAGEFSRRSVLPSFLYIPGRYDISTEAITIPWQPEGGPFVGVFARDHGGKVPARLVSSAKSWLCHNKADRRSKILPWGTGEDVSKVSPVQATAAYLRHIRAAWNAGRGDNDDLYLENQLVIITVPASFDEVARDLTTEAAALAGLKQVTLLEEPLAAFYSWLIDNESDWADKVSPEELILVCDVGGGTTDFTLIYLRQVEGSPRFERIAVGDHLILGGDNIDFALARQVETQAGGTSGLSQDRWKTLCHQCRQAKENILSNRSETERITLMGSGGRLIAGTLSAKIERRDLEKTVLDGFFPLVDPTTERPETLRKGISEVGLPFEQEPAITKHLGWFLERHREDVSSVLPKPPIPDWILFNGGSLKPQVIQDRIRQAVRYWFNAEVDERPKILENPDHDLAVALGAAYYGMVKAGRGVRVGSGSPRGYYLGVHAPAESATPGDSTRVRQAVCLVERGLDEGSTIELPDKKFEVRANQPVSFEVYSSSYRTGDRTGDLIAVDETLTALPPMQTVIQFGKKGIKSRIPVNIQAEYTEIGSLALWCRSAVSNHRWRLQFQLRSVDGQPIVDDSEVFDDELLQAAKDDVVATFRADSDAEMLAGLMKRLAGIIERPKEKWPLSLIRLLADTLLDHHLWRGISGEHEIRWLNLVGYTLRPGVGDSFDPQRIKALWKIYTQGPCFANNAQAANEWWILWRRVAAGLKPGQQRQILQDLTPIVMPKKGNGVKLPPQQKLEIWMTVANLEYLLVKDKIKWGRKLLSELKPKKTKPQFFWALSRLGARDLLYGPVDRVIPPDEITRWISRLLEQNWRNPKPVGAALIQLARKTGDRARDLRPEVAESVMDWLTQHEHFDDQRHLIRDVVPVAQQEESAIFGEALPAGLVLHVEPD